MTRLNLVLVAAVMASAFYLVHIQYQSRRLFVEVERAQSLARKLETERERPLRIEKIAKEQLSMRPATPAITQYVQLPLRSASAAGAKP
jgi:cell division protein FtsL